jgi:hypothetical protein
LNTVQNGTEPVRTTHQGSNDNERLKQEPIGYQMALCVPPPVEISDEGAQVFGVTEDEVPQAIAPETGKPLDVGT